MLLKKNKNKDNYIHKKILKISFKNFIAERRIVNGVTNKSLKMTHDLSSNSNFHILKDYWMNRRKDICTLVKE